MPFCHLESLTSYTKRKVQNIAILGSVEPYWKLKKTLYFVTINKAVLLMGEVYRFFFSPKAPDFASQYAIWFSGNNAKRRNHLYP